MEIWKLNFSLRNEQHQRDTNEDKVRNHIFEIIKRLNDVFDYLPDFELLNEDVKIQKFPYEVKYIYSLRSKYQNWIKLKLYK
jgi:hypothetical protein